MKRIMMIMVLGALMACPVLTNAQDWQSTSAMQGSGSSYSSQVTAVGATGVTDMATTTTSSSNNGPRRAKKDGEGGDFNETGENGTGDNGSPIGDAVLPLLLMAVAFGGYVAIRRRKTAN